MTVSERANAAAVTDSAVTDRPILVVDDDAATRYQVARMLRQAGYEVLEAANGTQGLEIAVREVPALVILDVRMPDILGFEVAERLRAEPATAQIAIMHLSATYTGSDAKVTGLRKGADVYLTHPIDDQVLLEAARALLRIQRYKSELVHVLARERGARQEAQRALEIAERAEQQRSRLLRELEQALRARDELLAMATHDLRSPLSALQLKLEYLVRVSRGDLDFPAEERERGLVAAQGQAREIGQLLDRLLDTTRISFGKTTIQWEQVDLSALASRVAEQVRDQAAAAGCELTVEAGDAVIGTWDHIRLEQVVGNLLSNAIKYAAGAPIVVRVSGDEAQARLEVQDRGPGILPEDQARLFTAFEQGSPGAGSGFGLGLWIVRRIVDALGGEVRVQSAVGEGSTFTVILPKTSHGGT